MSEGVTNLKKEVVMPNLSNFIKSLRDVGYSFEVAVADILDNSISAGADYIDIKVLEIDGIRFEMLDNGWGMGENELIEAMRLASRDPDGIRKKEDLGRFGLGLKTSSFSQAKSLTVIKKDGAINAKRWDLDFISEQNQWMLITPERKELSKYSHYEELLKLESGTIVAWEKIDRFENVKLANMIKILRDHLSLTFHRFLEARPGIKKLNILVNNLPVEAFNPFNPNNPATQELETERIAYYNDYIEVQPFILPHHTKMTQKEFDRYSTAEGYIKSQGFYLYRANRLLVHGTWWGLHKASDAHKLVRIRIDISNNQDRHWGIDIKKSRAYPEKQIKGQLKRIIRQTTTKGSRPYTGRGRRVVDKTKNRVWCLVPQDEKIHFALNTEYPSLIYLLEELDEERKAVLSYYLRCVQAYIPLEAIQAQLQENPYLLNQKEFLAEDDIQARARTLIKEYVSSTQNILNIEL